MKKGLKKIDPYSNGLSIKFNFNNNIIIINSVSEINLLLNLFIINENFELDVIECESFCENSGKWI